MCFTSPRNGNLFVIRVVIIFQPRDFDLSKMHHEIPSIASGWLDLHYNNNNNRKKTENNKCQSEK